MKDAFKKIVKVGSESMSIKMEIFIKDFGRKICIMEREFRIIKMDQNMMGLG